MRNNLRVLFWLPLAAFMALFLALSGCDSLDDSGGGRVF